MIGRGAQGRPLFLEQVAQYLKSGEKLAAPSRAVQLETILRHYDAMIAHHGRQGVRIARKHLAWYCNSLRNATEFRRVVNVLDDPDKVKDQIRAFYEPLVENEIKLDRQAA